jgi:hypothetical protein
MREWEELWVSGLGEMGPCMEQLGKEPFEIMIEKERFLKPQLMRSLTEGDCGRWALN